MRIYIIQQSAEEGDTVELFKSEIDAMNRAEKLEEEGLDVWLYSEVLQ